MASRYRNWATIVYKDSAPSNWQELLDEEHIPCFISPLHDKDINVDATHKKPHWHVIFMFSGNKTKEQAQEISDSFLSGVAVEHVKDLRAYARYLCHLDNPEKHLYQADDVISLGGCDYFEMIGSMADIDEALAEMMEWCREQGIFSFARLCDYSSRERRDWFRVLTSKRTVYISAYLKSLQWEFDHGLLGDYDLKNYTDKKE